MKNNCLPLAMGLSKDKSNEKLLSEVMSLIAKVENSNDADQIFATIKKLQILFEANNKTNSRELDLVNSILKKEMRIYYRTGYAKQKKDLVARLNQLLTSI